jgi:hypothetical protein
MGFDYVADYYASLKKAPVAPAKTNDYGNLLDAAATRHGVDRNLIGAMMAQESAGNARAVSSKGAQGLMQLMPATAQELGVTDPFDPAQNIDAGTKYIGQLLKRYNGDTDKALMAYNAGMGNVDSGKASGFQETQDYVRRIRSRLAPQETAPAGLPPMPPVVEGLQRPTAPAKEFDYVADFFGPNAPAPLEGEALQSKMDAMGLSATKRPAAQRVTNAKELTAPGGKVEPRTWTDTAVDALPTAGGILGAIVGGIGTSPTGPGAIAGATGGGMIGSGIGETARQAINSYRGKNDNDVYDAAHQVGKTMLIDGAMGYVGGQVANKVVLPAARAATKWAFKPTPEAVRVVPGTGIVDDILENQIPLSQAGADQARTLTTQARQIADDALASYDRAGGQTIPLTQILQSTVQHPGGVGESATQVAMRNVGNTQRMLDEVGRVWGDAFASHPQQLTATAANSLKRQAQKNAGDVFYGEVGNPAFSKHIQADIATGGKAALEDAVPGLRAMNAETQRRATTSGVVQNALRSNAAATSGDSVAEQLLAARALATGDPASVALSIAGKVGKTRRGAAWLGRKAYNSAGRNDVAQVERFIAGATGEHDAATANRRAVREQTERNPMPSKKKVDDLYSKYRGQ